MRRRAGRSSRHGPAGQWAASHEPAAEETRSADEVKRRLDATRDRLKREAPPPDD